MAACRPTVAFVAAGLEPVELGAKEGLALLNGTQFSTAYALAALFEAEALFQSALVTGALSTDAARAPTRRSIRASTRCAGIAARSRRPRRCATLMAGSAIRASHLVGDERVQDPYCLRCQPQVMGACLDVLRKAADTLETEANGVTDNPLIFAEDDTALSGGNFHAEPVAFAADMIALAVCEIGSLAERRIAMLVDPALSGMPAFLTPKPGLNSGFMIPQVTAAALVSENKQRAYPASVDSIPTSANQEDHVSMAAHGARRLLPWSRTPTAVIGIELLAAAQGCDFHAPLASSAPLEAVRALVRAKVPHLDNDRHFHPDMEAAIALVRSGAVVEAAGDDRIARRRWSKCMTPVEVNRGTSPVILGLPHTGTHVPADIWDRLNANGRLLADTDWHIDRLYDGLLSGAAHCARHLPSLRHRRQSRSRRAQSLYPGQNTTGLVPADRFRREPIWEEGAEPDEADIASAAGRVPRPLS